MKNGAIVFPTYGLKFKNCGFDFLRIKPIIAILWAFRAIEVIIIAIFTHLIYKLCIAIGTFIMCQCDFFFSHKYSNGYKLYKDSCDAWFIAFNTDMQIDNLYDADVSFMSQKFGLGYNPMQGWFYGAGTEKEPTLHTVKLTDKDTAETKADGLFAYKYKWNRIESVDEFKKNETLSDDYVENLKGKTWVLRFTETEYTYYMSTYTGTQEYTVISDVTILRLHFKSNGRVYNLGVVDNKTSKADGPVNEDTEALDGLLKKLQALWDSIVSAFERFGKWLSKYWWILLIIVGVIALGLLSAFVKPVAKVLWWTLKIVFYIVTLPVWLIIWGVRAVKKNKQ